MRNKILIITSLLFTPFALAVDQPAVNTPATPSAATPVIGNAEAGKQKITVCATCHGIDGNSPIPANPNLAGQHIEYLIRAMTEYQQGANGPRNNMIMAGMVAGLSAQDIADIAAYYSIQTEKVGEVDPALVKKGEALYRGGEAERGIPACIACHGPVGQGNGPADFPKVANQNPDYVIAALKEYQSKTRINAMMNDIAIKMTDDDIKAVASYIYGLYPTGMKLPEATPAAATTAPAAATNTTAAPTATTATTSVASTAATQTAPTDASTKPAATVNETSPPGAATAPVVNVNETKANDATTAPAASANMAAPVDATTPVAATVNQTAPADSATKK